MPSELWKAICGYEGLYEVSDLGNVRRIAPALGTWPGYVLRGSLDRGYRYVGLSLGPKRGRSFKVAGLVCAAFHGPRPSQTHQVNHKNGTRDDDRAVNLEWVTPSENVRHRFDVLQKPNRRGSQHRRATVTETDVAIMLALKHAGASASAIAEQFRITRQMAKSITGRHTWKHIEMAASIPDQYKVYKKPRPRGTANHASKLNVGAIREIRSSSESSTLLSHRFGVSVTNICNIRKRRAWAWVQ